MQFAAKAVSLMKLLGLTILWLAVVIPAGLLLFVFTY